MARLIYSAICSLDGYVADRDGAFNWAAPDEQVHAFVNDLERGIGTMLLGRRMYDVLAYWEDVPDLANQPPVIHDFAAIWKAAEKIVYSRTLQDVRSSRTRIERDFDPNVVRQLKDSSASDLTIGGPTLAAEAFSAGLVNEIQLFLNPIIVGGGNAALPRDLRVDLELTDQRRFANGVVYVRYDVSSPPRAPR